MNLWRVPVDEAAGRVLGEPEPVTAPSVWCGSPNLSRDGKTFAYASLDFRSTLFRKAFDPAREEAIGLAAPVLKSTLPIRDHAISPDGRRVAFTTFGHEDLYVVGADGSSFRRLTDDPFRDRGPSWSPIGDQIVFYSDRSGEYELWSIRSDGSGLRQLTHGAGATNYPVWSPDGSRIATADVRGKSWSVLDAVSGETVKEFSKTVRAGIRFWPFGWSSDAAQLLGLGVNENGSPESIAVYSMADGRYEELHAVDKTAFVWPAWLADGHRVVFRDKKGIFLLSSGRVRQLVAVGGYAVGESLGVSRDDRSITYTETAAEGDVWLARFDSGSRAK